MANRRCSSPNKVLDVGFPRRSLKPSATRLSRLSHAARALSVHSQCWLYSSPPPPS